MSGIFTLHWSWLVVILGMAVATYVTRISGLLLLRGVVVKGRMKAALDAVPPSILMAVIIAAIVSALPVINTVGVITAIKTDGGMASSAAFMRPLTTTPRMSSRPEIRVA